jgi:hypothetical protein
MTDPLSSCKQCGNLIRHADRFCPRCGTPQGDPALTASSVGQPSLEQHQTSTPPPPIRIRAQSPEATTSPTTLLPVATSELTNLKVYYLFTGRAISKKLCELLQTAESCQTPDLIAQMVGEALSILRFYELDALPPHSPYAVERWQLSGNVAPGLGMNVVGGAPNPAKLLGIRDQARQYIEQWNSIPQASAMQHLRAELASESHVNISAWIAKRLGLALRAVPSLGAYFNNFYPWLWFVAGGIVGLKLSKIFGYNEHPGFAIASGISFAVALFILARLAHAYVRYAFWKSSRMKRWNEWLRSQRLNP